MSAVRVLCNPFIYFDFQMPLFYISHSFFIYYAVMELMLRKIQFTKLSATGNDFILFDNRTKVLSGDEYAFFKKICTRRTGIGADGILLIEKSDGFDFKMRYYNADGFEAEMCGNGARASAFYATQYFFSKNKVTFEVNNESYTATVEGSRVALLMQPPEEINFKPNALETNGFTEGASLVVGVPHYVLFTDNNEAVDVDGLGAYYCHHAVFQPRQTNVNFVSKINNEFKIRTYERGVYEETLSCGTGTVASAYVIHHTQNQSFPLNFHAGGGLLTVDFDPETKRHMLIGTVDVIYQGTVEISVLTMLNQVY
ncbi:MAG: diaminopimelate epimerase [Calditrichaeota bacterium]|nr:MAG: diaminopimelate epimerase [Calditrichota bacterium]